MRSGKGKYAMTRAEFVRQLAASGLLTATGLPVACGGGDRPRPADAPRDGCSVAPVSFKGVNYDTGTSYAPPHLSRGYWSTELMTAEIERICGPLGCNAVHVFGSELARLADTARTALDRCLHVIVQPRRIDTPPSGQLAHLGELAEEAERLGQRFGRDAMTLDLGCELSIFMAGIIPGATFLDRASALMTATPAQHEEFNRSLNAHLEEARTVARARFGGRITYGSGMWERVDWNGFDLVGVDLYRDANNADTFVDDLRAYRQWQKPVVVLEFGCTTHEGADRKGAVGDDIVDWEAPRPTVTPGTVRSEETQAAYIVDLLGIFRAEGIVGAFVFELIEPSYPHSSQPQYDLDMASFGILKAVPADPEDPASPYTAAPKAAFDAVARFHAQTD